jgi:hypothetical protein
MSIEDLKREFIVEDDVLEVRLEPLVSKALKHCRIDKKGQVLITDSKLSSKDQVRLVLCARAIGAQLDSLISREVTVAEIATYLRLPANQVRARCNDILKEKTAEVVRAGVYRADQHKIEPFLDSLAEGKPTSKR